MIFVGHKLKTNNLTCFENLPHDCYQAPRSTSAYKRTMQMNIKNGLHKAGHRIVVH